MSTASYAVDLDPETARRLSTQGASVLFLDVPVGTVIAVDQQTYVAGPKFRGVKMLPPGPHLFAYSSASGHGDFSAFTSFFVHCSLQQIIVRRWSHEHELLLLFEEEEAERYAEGVRNFDFDEGMAPYNLRANPVWKTLSGWIDSPTITRLSPSPHGNISILAEATPGDGRPATNAEQELAAQLAARREASGNSGAEEHPPQAEERQPEGNAAGDHNDFLGRCRYTAIPRTLKSPSMTAAELTQANLDKSTLLEEIVKTKLSGQYDSLLGELQFAFLAFVVGQSLESFGQWKAILVLCLGCIEAPLRTQPAFFAQLLKAVNAQLAYSLPALRVNTEESEAVNQGVPMVDEVIGSSFLRRLFSAFFDTLFEADEPLDIDLEAAARELQATLQERLGWGSLEADEGDASDDEYAPVVVKI